jgi:hypothetical protein
MRIIKRIITTNKSFDCDALIVIIFKIGGRDHELDIVRVQLGL